MHKPNLPKSDAIVVGSGPNGLCAAIRLAQAGWRVIVLEAADTPGGGVRSAELTLPGFVHDMCAAVFPMAVCSPFLRTLPLQEHGVEWVFPKTALAHPLEDGSAALLQHSLAETTAGLGRDGAGYQALIGDMVPIAEALFSSVLAPLRLPKHPFLMAGFGLKAMRSARSLAHAYFRTETGRALLGGIAGHAMVPLEKAASAAPALVLALAAHAAGWPFVKGGSQNLTRGLISYLRSLGGEVITGWKVESLDELPAARAVLLDVTPRQLLKIAGERLPTKYRGKLEKYRYGMGVYKIDWALKEPIPWRAPECRLAGTVHLGGSLDEISDSERKAWRGELNDRPFVILAQQSLADPGRAPAGQHTAWGYCHVANGFFGDMVGVIERQVERYAPGFRDCVLARAVTTPLDFEQRNANLVGGDIGGGAATLKQLLLRPTASFYRIPAKGLYLCSSSTPPGAGVHGMCGYFAAMAVLRAEGSDGKYLNQQ